MNTFERVRRVVARMLNVTATQITPQSSLSEDLGSDSLEKVEIVMALEEEFCFQFDDEAMALGTVQDVVDYIEAKLGTRVE